MFFQHIFLFFFTSLLLLPISANSDYLELGEALNRDEFLRQWLNSNYDLGTSSQDFSTHLIQHVRTHIRSLGYLKLDKDPSVFCSPYLGRWQCYRAFPMNVAQERSLIVSSKKVWSRPPVTHTSTKTEQIKASVSQTLSPKVRCFSVPAMQNINVKYLSFTASGSVPITHWCFPPTQTKAAGIVKAQENCSEISPGKSYKLAGILEWMALKNFLSNPNSQGLRASELLEHAEYYTITVYSATQPEFGYISLNGASFSLSQILPATAALSSLRYGCIEE